MPASSPGLRGTYRFSGVVHRLSRSFWIYSATQTVNNAVAMLTSNIRFNYLGLGPGTNTRNVRSTNIAQNFDRSRNPNMDTHSQVMTSNVLHYTACAPCSSPHKSIT